MSRKRKNLRKMADVAARYEAICIVKGIKADDRTSTLMDLTTAEDQFLMNWDKLLDFDEFNFCHDVFGIKRHIDRSNYPGHIGGCFLPRCARATQLEEVQP
jgi:hypothetical protein